MSSERKFKDFCWNEVNFIGSGATCKVYRGINMTDGTPVAVKVYTNQITMDPGHEILKLFNDEHIVKFYYEGFYKELGRNVAVIELCSHGDLHSMITRPRNSRGLNDKEFKILLSCLYNAKKALRDRNVVHRDIKPLNICYHINELGKRCFKLIDFGFARTLTDQEFATTFAGTPEFCYPGLYQRYLDFRRGGAHRGRGESVYLDLWSTGVTFYLGATGLLPFRIVNKSSKDNPEILVAMTLDKPRGVVGRELTKDGQMKNYYRLPGNIRLSQSLSRLLVPMLARLLEIDEAHMWNFADYFDACKDILDRRCIRLFAPCDGRVQKSYLHQITNETVQKEFRYLWRKPDPNEEHRPLPPNPELQEESHEPSSIAIFHNCSRLSENAITESNVNLLRLNDKHEVLIVVQLDPKIWGIGSTKSKYSSQPFINRNYASLVQPTLLVNIKEAIRRFTLDLWDYAREIKTFRNAFRLYPVAVDSLCIDLARGYEKVLFCVPFVKSFEENYDASLEEAAQSYLRGNLGYKKWMDKVKEMEKRQEPGKVPGTDADVAYMAKMAEEISNSNETNEIVLKGNLGRVRRMAVEMQHCYAKERQYFLDLREAFHSWMREVYCPNATNLKKFEEHLEEVKTRLPAQPSGPVVRASVDGLNDMNLASIYDELKTVMQKAENFRKSLDALKMGDMK